MVTSHSDKNLIMTCIKADCDDYIVKPVDKETIIKKLEKIGLAERLDVFVRESAQESPLIKEPQGAKANPIEEIIVSFRQGKIDLPSLPHINIKFNVLISKGADFHEIAGLLKQDMAIASKLIGISNSVYYGGIEKNKTLEQALSRLGLDVTRQYVDAMGNRALYNATSKKYIEYVERLWEHSLSCAYASQIITEFLGLKLTDDAFTMGLLHDIGKLVFLHIVGELEKRGKFGKDVDTAELLNDLDKYHSEFGSTLLKRWNFSNNYVVIAMYHDKLQDAEAITRELLVVHFANLLAKSLGYGQIQEEEEEIDLENIESSRLLKLNAATIDRVKDEVKKIMEELKSSFS